LTGSADVQKDRIEVQILGHGRDERIAVIDHVVLEGEPTREEVWRKLDDYFAGEMLNAFGKTMRIACALVDSGNWQHEVTNFTRELRARHIYASKGSNIPSRQPIGRPTLVDVKYNGKVLARGAEQYQIGVSVLKSTLYARLQADELMLPADRHVRFSQDLPEEYFRQLASEYRNPKGQWEKSYDHNEVLDLFVYGMAAAMHHSVQVHRMRELDWQRLEELYEPAAALAAPATKEQLGVEPVRTRGTFLPTMANVKKSSWDGN